MARTRRMRKSIISHHLHVVPVVFYRILDNLNLNPILDITYLEHQILFREVLADEFHDFIEFFV